jgi:NAD-specific glutamate dehydrogenase
MRFRVLSFFLIILMGSSCEFFNLKKKSQLQEVDTIIDFSSVDVFPTFDACKSFIDKEKKTDCFRNTIHQHISKNLAENKIEVKNPVKEIVNVVVLINNEGNVSIQKITTSGILKTEIPTIDSLITASLQNLPRLSPATKRGIPVATQYQIPIQINVN